MNKGLAVNMDGAKEYQDPQRVQVTITMKDPQETVIAMEIEHVPIGDVFGYIKMILQIKFSQIILILLSKSLTLKLQILTIIKYYFC